jgi:hypothetical protein
MRIIPATIAQFQQSANGRWVEVDADVGSVALQVKELADQLGVELHLRVSEVTGIFKVVQVMPGGEEQLVTSAQECDGRLVDRLREVTSPSYDLAADADKLEQDKLRQFEHEQAEKVGDVAERLAHALRTDLNERKTF